jgi:hypothetical protein
MPYVRGDLRLRHLTWYLIDPAERFVLSFFPAEGDLALIREVPEEGSAVHSRALCDLRDGRLLIAVLHEQVQGGVSTRSRAFGARLPAVTS